jgi:hypothetical protein
MKKPIKPKKPKKPLKSAQPPSKIVKNNKFVFEKYKSGYAFLSDKDDASVNLFYEQNASEEDKEEYGDEPDQWDYFWDQCSSLGYIKINIALIKKIAKELNVDPKIVSLDFWHNGSDAELIAYWETEKSEQEYQKELQQFENRFKLYEKELAQWEKDIEQYEKEQKEYKLWKLEKQKEKLLNVSAT